MKPHLTVIIPFLNEAENIPGLVSALNNFFSESAIKAEVIFVNDGSNDNSVPLLKAQQHIHYQGRIISLSKNFGSHAALRSGILHSRGSWITFLYADLQDPVDLLTELYYKCQEGYDIVWATRSSVRSGSFEKLFSRFYSLLMRKYVSVNYPRSGFDIVMFNESIRIELNQAMDSNSSIFLQILTMGFRQTTIYYKKQERLKGKSKWTLSKKIKLLIDSFVAFSYVPIRMVSAAGILFALAGLLWMSYIVFRALVFNDLASGWPALISILMIGFGITNISLGIIAEYLWRTLDASKKRKPFIIEKIDVLNGPDEQ